VNPVNAETERQPFYIQDNFCETADSLRTEFEEKLAAMGESEAGLTPLAYVFFANKYRFLAANGDQIFTQAIMDDLINRLCTWATETLGAFHVSTPQVRLYISGCNRDLVRDALNARWHYLLFLSHDDAQFATVRIMKENRDASDQFGLGSLLKSKPLFNRLLVHDISDAYGIEFTGKSMDPLQGMLILDGYLW
jgi:hypothetical protein